MIISNIKSHTKFLFSNLNCLCSCIHNVKKRKSILIIFTFSHSCILDFMLSHFPILAFLFFRFLAFHISIYSVELCFYFSQKVLLHQCKINGYCESLQHVKYPSDCFNQYTKTLCVYAYAVFVHASNFCLLLLLLWILSHQNVISQNI